MDRQHDFMISTALQVRTNTSPPQIKCISNLRKRATPRTWMQVISEYFGSIPAENQSSVWQTPVLRESLKQAGDIIDNDGSLGRIHL